MATVAEQLRQAREAQNLTVHEVADITKIRTDHIRALDEGDYDVFPAPVYIRGFVRTYAGFLHLDVSRLIEQLNEELSHSKKHHEPPPLAPRPRGILDFFMFQLSRLNWKVLLTLTVVTLILVPGVYACRAWASHKARDPLAGLGPGLYEPAKRGDGEVLPMPAPHRK